MYGWCTYPRFIHRKKTIFILALVTSALIVLTLFTFPRGTPVISDMSLYGAKDSDFKPVPYTRLAPCERKPEGDINCLDIRRNGTTRLRQAQLVLTRILRIFDLIAKKHGIRYWLYRGTLLGAARHNGHVPFDNDIDICIPKADYEKFVKYGVKELPGDIFFQTEETDRHWEILPFSGLLGKLRDMRSCYGCGRAGNCKHKNGLQLDMFVVEMDSSGNFLELFSHSNLFRRRYIYGPYVRKPSDIFPLAELNFDGFPLPAPREWKKILHSLYGDFMMIPTNKPVGHLNSDPFHSCDEMQWGVYRKDIP